MLIGILAAMLPIGLKQDLTNALERYRTLVKNRKIKQALNPKPPEIYHLNVYGQ